jgi:hypothetical protein
MPLLLGQLAYICFPEIGSKVLASTEVPSEIQQTFIQQVIDRRHWLPYAPPRTEYRAAYLHQVNSGHSLFGWLYDAGMDDFGRSNVPYFICYYIAEPLDSGQLENIFKYLSRGPLSCIDRQALPACLETIVAPDISSYNPTGPGVEIPLALLEHSQSARKQGELLDLFVSIDEHEILMELNVQRYEQQGGLPIHSHNLSKRTDVDAKELKSPVPIEFETSKTSWEYRGELQYQQKFFKKIQLKNTLSNYLGNRFNDIQQVLEFRNNEITPIVTPTNIFTGVTPVKEKNKAVVAKKTEISMLTETGPSQDKKSQRAKVALLIGVSDYGHGFNPLPGIQEDLQTIKRVLQHPEMGGFTEVKDLFNPDPLVMQEAIETLSSEGQENDILLLYFSGYGIRDDKGGLHLATRIARRSSQGRLIRSGVVPVSFIHEVMSDSRAIHQVLILDCCFSETLHKDTLAQDASSVNVGKQLSRQGRVVITSSTSTQPYFEQTSSEMLTYTHYLVEGIETGIADLDNDGEISIEELHEYATTKVRKAAPAIKPEIYGLQKGFKLLIAQAPISDMKLRYRKEVERLASYGEISVINRSILDMLSNSLGLSPDEAAAIETAVLKPYRIYQKKLQQYTQKLAKAMQEEIYLSDETCNKLKDLQQVLGLTDEAVAIIEDRIARQIKATSELATPAPTGTTVPSIRATQQSLGMTSKENVDPNSLPVRRDHPWFIRAVDSVIDLLLGR